MSHSILALPSNKSINTQTSQAYVPVKNTTPSLRSQKGALVTEIQAGETKETQRALNDLNHYYILALRTYERLSS